MRTPMGVLMIALMRRAPMSRALMRALTGASLGVSKAPAVLAAVAAGLLIAACAGTPEQNHYYLLRPEPYGNTGAMNPSTRFAMGPVQVAPYIDQSGLILEVAPGEVRPARHHQWAEPVAGAIGKLLLAEVSRSVGADVLPAAASDAPLVGSVQIDQLHGTVEGDALLVARWRVVRNSDGAVRSYRFAETRALTADGYAALADAQKALLVALATRIADSLLDIDRRTTAGS